MNWDFFLSSSDTIGFVFIIILVGVIGSSCVILIDNAIRKSALKKKRYRKKH